MELPDIENKLCEIVALNFGIKLDRIDKNIPLTEQGLDSLLVMDFIIEVENAFDVSIPDDVPTIKKLATISAAAVYVQNSLNGNGNSGQA